MGRLRFSRMVRSNVRLNGKTAVVTGCNTGIGKITVKDLYCRGCRVIMACRDVTKAEGAAQEIRQETTGVPDVGEIVVTRLDLSSFASVRQCANHLLQTEPRINLLINNAGLCICSKKMSEDGFEAQFATNHLGHFLFTLLLLPRLRTSAPARIVIVASVIYRFGRIHFDDINLEKSNAYGPMKAYMQSKLANMLFSKELSRRLGRCGVTTYALHPGLVHSDAGRYLDDAYFPGIQWSIDNFFHVFSKSPEQGAQTTIHCAINESLGDETGCYYVDCRREETGNIARDPVMAYRLWEESVKWVGLQGYDPFSVEDRPPTAPPIVVKSKSG